MKRRTAILVVLLHACVVLGQTNFSSQVSQMWLDGQKQEVLNIANQRLASDTNDMAGLLLRMEYEVEFLIMSSLTNTMNEVERVGSGITHTNFAAVFPDVQQDIADLRAMITVAFPLSPEKLADEQAKGNVAGKPLTCINALGALEADGLLE